ncbi:MAG TPA: sigma-54 dependent transcriptional regulator [Candidatus Polarisedimenticolaceae bacterium]|nr:sigma-54 dependent transcriptional regulator [Candidatus Polarisedimenticolaceae bacterium]
MPKVLLVDDERNLRGTLARALKLEGYATVEAEDGEQALRRLADEPVDAVLLDLQMPGRDGFSVLEVLRERGIAVPVIVLTAHGTIEKAVRAVQLGAADFVEKPPSTERLLVSLENALRRSRLEADNRRLATEAGLGEEILGSSPPMKQLAETVQRVAPTQAPVLLLGENGAGKELVARAIHAGSARRSKPLVTLNCAAIPDTLFESELFGHARGAFTGATDARRGKFQEADGGTLFLDEVGEIPLALQPKLLRALESGEVERVGGRGERVDVRIVAATNRDLEAEVAAGRFRQDLYFRLLVVPVRVPPLRERREDVPLLAAHFLAEACRKNRIRAKILSESALGLLRSHSWPGNVRELRNAMERVAILVAEPVIEPRHLDFLQTGVAAAPPSSPAAAQEDLASYLERVEREAILRVCERHHWRMTKAAAELGLERSHLYKKLKALGIERPAED